MTNRKKEQPIVRGIPSKIGIIGDALAPNFNEAFANQMYLLSQALNVPVLTGNDLGPALFKKRGQYWIVNTRFLRGRTRIPVLFQINGALFYPFVKLFERKLDVIFLTGSINSRFIRHMNLGKCILVINSMPFSRDDKEAKDFVREFAHGLLGIIAQSQRIRDRLSDFGIAPQKIRLIYPWLDLNKFKYTDPPDTGEFKILFASAPNLEDPSGEIFESKGLPLLLEAFKEFARSRKASLCLLWRGHHFKTLEEKIKRLGLEGEVRVINEVADTPGLYAQSHVTVIPFLSSSWSPEIPLSAAESLACGRPVVTTNVIELAEIVQKYKCGYVVKPAKEELLAGLEECQANYSLYQKNCRQAAEELFRFDIQAIEGRLFALSPTSD